jgi:hypothetical protein
MASPTNQTLKQDFEVQTVAGPLIGRARQSRTEHIRYSVDYGQWLEKSDSIVGVEFTFCPETCPPLEITIGSIESGYRQLFIVTGGCDGTAYTITARALTASGQVKQDRFEIQIGDCCPTSSSCDSAGLVVDGLFVGTNPDGVHDFIVKGNSVLFDGSCPDACGTGTGDMVVEVNKCDTPNTAAMEFQTAYVGKARIGLIGSDRFCIQVSEDGINWRDVLCINNTTGEITTPDGELGGSPTPPEGGQLGGVYSEYAPRYHFQYGVDPDGHLAFRRILGEDLPLPRQTALGGIFSAVAPVGQFMSGVGLDGHPTFRPLSGLDIPPAQYTALGGIFASMASGPGVFVYGVDTQGNLKYRHLTQNDLPIPTPTSTTLGGVYAMGAPAKQVQVGIDTLGKSIFAPVQNLLPLPTPATLGAVYETHAPLNWVMTGIGPDGKGVYRALKQSDIPVPPPTHTTLGGVYADYAPDDTVQVGISTTGAPIFKPLANFGFHQPSRIGEYTYVAYAGQTIVGGTDIHGQRPDGLVASDASINVYVNGVRLAKDEDWFVANNLNITVLRPLDANDLVVIEHFKNPQANYLASAGKIETWRWRFDGVTRDFLIFVKGVALEPSSVESVLISIDGVMQDPGIDFTLNGSIVTFDLAPRADAKSWGIVGVPLSPEEMNHLYPAPATYNRYTYLATTHGQTVFEGRDKFGMTMAGLAEPSVAVKVYVNGVLIEQNEFIRNSDTEIVLRRGVSRWSSVQVEVMLVSGSTVDVPTAAPASYLRCTYEAVEGQTEFIGGDKYGVPLMGLTQAGSVVVVHVNGVRLEDENYEITGDTSISLARPVVAGTSVIVELFTVATTSGSIVPDHNHDCGVFG